VIFAAAAERATFWTISARRTTGWGRTLTTRHESCRGGTTATRSPAWATGPHWLTTIHGTTVT